MTTAAKNIVNPDTAKETPVSAIVREMSISAEKFSNRLTQVSGGVLSFSHHFVQGSEASLIDKIKATVKNKIEGYKAQTRREREAEQVMQMSNSMLKDLGLTSGDLDSLKSGLISFADLNARREASRRRFN